MEFTFTKKIDLWKSFNKIMVIFTQEQEQETFSIKNNMVRGKPFVVASGFKTPNQDMCKEPGCGGRVCPTFNYCIHHRCRNRTCRNSSSCSIHMCANEYCRETPVRTHTC